MQPTILYDHHVKKMPAVGEVIRSLSTLPDDTVLGLLSSEWSEPSGQMLLWCSIRYAQSGHQVFCVGPRLQESFSYTSLRKVPFDAVNLPYPGFYLALPESPWEIWGGPQTQWHQVEGAYLAERFSEREGRIWSIYIWGKENELSVGIGDDACFWMNLSLGEASIQGKDIEEYVQGLMGDTCRDRTSHLLGGQDEKTRKRTQKSAQQVIRVLFNTLLYIDSEHPEISVHQRVPAQRRRLQRKLQKVRNPKKRTLMAADLDQYPTTTVTYLGSSIEEQPPLTDTEGRRGPRAHIVRGHWKVVPTGSREDPVYKRVRIEPYRRGRDLAGVIHGRTYKVR